MIQQGNSVLTLSGTNTYTGSLTVNAGTVQFSADANLGSTSTVNTVILNGGTLSDTNTTGTLTLTHPITVNSGGGTINLAGTGTAGKLAIAAAQITGSGSLTKTGGADLQITADQAFTGAWVINGGYVEAQSANALGTGVASNTVTVNTGANLVAHAATLTNNLTLNTGSILSVVGSNSITGAIGITGTAYMSPSNFTSSTGYTMTVSGPISGSGALTESLTQNGSTATTGTLVLSGTNTYAGETTISSGTLQIGAGGTSGSIVGNVANSSALVFNRSDNVSFPGIISGGGSAASGTGTLALTANNSYTGGTQVNTGTLQFNGGSTQASAVSVSTGAALSIVNAGATSPVSLSSAALTFGTGATTLNLGAGTSWNTTTPLLSVGTLTANGTTTINLTSASGSIASGVYQLISYSGPIGGNGFAGFTIPSSLGPRTTAALVNDSADGLINVQINGDSPVWTGATDNNWDTSTQNWNLIAAGTPTAYIQGDSVLFDDTATGSTSINLGITATPTSVTFNNSALTYTISGTGKISGATTLTLTAPARLSSQPTMTIPARRPSRPARFNSETAGRADRSPATSWTMPPWSITFRPIPQCRMPCRERVRSRRPDPTRLRSRETGQTPVAPPFQAA